MADPAEITSAIETLQRALQTYAGYEGPVDGILTPELYETLSTFTEGFQQIEGVARIINSGDTPIEGIYDPALGEALGQYFSGLELIALRAISLSDMEQAKQMLRAADAPQQFIDNPQLLFQLIDRDLAGVVDAMNTLEADGQLNGPPQELTDEQRAAQPEAIQALEEIVKADLQYYRGIAQASLEAAQAEEAALTDESTDEERAAVAGRIRTSTRSLELIDSGLNGINDIDPDQVNDPNFTEALRVYVEFLQRGNSMTAYTAEPPVPGQPLDLSAVLDASGGYSEEYRTFLKERMASEGYQERLELLTDKGDERTPDEELEFQIMSRTIALNTAMDAMIESGAYVPPAPGEPPRETLAIEEARPIVEEAIDYMVRKGRIEFDPGLTGEGEPEFDLASRMALQAFLIDLKGFLDIDVDDEAGLYSTALHEALAERLADEATRRRVADEYFKGNEEMVAQLLPALNTYLETFPADEDLGFPYSFSDDVLITMPQLRDNEASMMAATIDRMPQDETLAMNELMISLTGYGMEDFLPEGTISDELREQLELGGDRTELLGDLYTKVKQEAMDALELDGRPMSALEDEIAERLIERFNNLVEDNAAFDVVRAEYMRRYIREGVREALAAEQVADAGPHPNDTSEPNAFANAIPGAVDFAQAHGANTRSYFLIDPNVLEGVTPEVMRGFGGDIEKISATMEQALAAPTMGMLITDMEQDFERLSMSPIARRTLGEVRTALAEREELMESIYNDPRNAEFMDENGVMVVRGIDGATALLSQGANGFEMRYLEGAGIGSIEGLDESRILSVGEEFDLDALLIQTALAGYQSANQGAEWRNTHNPEFFELGGRQYVVGLDKRSNTIQVEELDEEFLTASNAALRVYSYNSNGEATTTEAFLQDPAYAFLQQNYERQFVDPSSADMIFEFMLHQLESTEADLALSIMGEFNQIDYMNLPTLEDAPLVEAENILTGLFMANRARPEEERTEPFIYLREGDDGGQNIYVVTPALKDEVVVAEDGTERTIQVLDTESPPVVRDISDPQMYQSMRDLFLELDVIPLASLEDPTFQEVRDWLSSGGRPPLREAPAPMPEYGAPTEEGLTSLYNSAAGFEARGRDIAFGEPITDVNTLVEVLGYDPNAAFLSQPFSDAENAYVVHGVEPSVWAGSADHHEFLNDHVLITTMVDGQVQTFALAKEALEGNPYRISAMIRMEHEYEREVNWVEIPNPTVYVANRDSINMTAEGIEIGVVEFDAFIRQGAPDYEEREVTRGPEGEETTRISRFNTDPAWWEQQGEWIRDLNEWKREIRAEEEDGAQAPSEERELTTAEMLAECIDEMTCDRRGGGTVDETAMAPVAIRPDA